MNCLGCKKQIFQPREGPLWIDGDNVDTCTKGGQHEPDDGSNTEESE